MWVKLYCAGIDRSAIQFLGLNRYIYHYIKKRRSGCCLFCFLWCFFWTSNIKSKPNGKIKTHTVPFENIIKNIFCLSWKLTTHVSLVHVFPRATMIMTKIHPKSKISYTWTVSTFINRHMKYCQHYFSVFFFFFPPTQTPHHSSLHACGTPANA